MEKLAAALWGPGTVGLVLCVGGWLTWKTRAVQLRYLGFILRGAFSGALSAGDQAGGMSSFRAMATALGGTMGTGNLAGVAVALTLGGPGAMLWMWLCAAVGMAVKFAEIALAVGYARPGPGGARRGGPMYYMQYPLGWGRVARLFAIACMGGAVVMGNLVQTGAMADMVYTAAAVPRWATGAAAMVLVGMVVAGGGERISRLAGLLVPAAAAGYLLVAGWAVWQGRDLVPAALEAIFREGLGLGPAAGGLAGYSVLAAARFGAARGVFSNEAGLGSSPIAYGCSGGREPALSGMWGVFEVFVDTMVCSTLTALVVLTGGGRLAPGADPAALLVQGLQPVLGAAAGGVLAVFMVVFALSSTFGWCFYGEKAAEFLWPGRPGAVLWYRRLYSGATLLGGLAAGSAVWLWADIFNGVMALCNLCAVAAMGEQAAGWLRRWERRRDKGPAR